MAQLALGSLERGEVLLRQTARVDVHLGRFGTRLYYIDKVVMLAQSCFFHYLNEVRNEVETPLVLVLYLTPCGLYVLFFCYLPLNANRIGTLLWAFLLGLLIDIFSGTPGQASGAMTLTALVQWPLLHAMAPKESLEDMVPSFRTLGVTKHLHYLLLLTIVHHTAFFLLESFSYFHLVDMLISLGSSIVLSMVIMLTMESVRDRKSKG